MIWVNRNLKRAVIFSLSTAVILIFTSILAAAELRSRSINQTVPTKTPTKKPEPPPPSSTDDEIRPTQTIVASPTVVFADTPVGGYLPTAEPCTEPPTVRALDTANVRAGPGTNFDRIAQLVYLEVRTIVGRAEFEPWWLIELSDRSNGWIFDGIVDVSGYIGNVPVVDPEIEPQQTPSASATWLPTVAPQCTPLPTHTPTPTATRPQPSETAASAERATDTAEPTEVQNLEPSPIETEIQPTAYPAAESTPTADSASAELTEIAQETPEDFDLDGENGDQSFDSNILLFAGVGLIVIGFALYLGRRIFS